MYNFEILFVSGYQSNEFLVFGCILVVYFSPCNHFSRLVMEPRFAFLRSHPDFPYSADSGPGRRDHPLLRALPRALQPNLTDFMLLELANGKPRLHLNLGGGTTHTLQLDRNIADNKDHLLEISWKSGQVKLELDPDTCMNDIINYRNLQAQNDNSGSR